ncbi:hypothetical protein BV898_09865 [Hypsibius exemplaris]|uniref:Uncharacterized protein n=1 Tax=Hypsibius exemplaris TaxID=2072580 RepID=A0A1W0WLE3_HYPEX|nr:hypothetical protein BV898_09865 [Hypsibius exemplaris]
MPPKAAKPRKGKDAKGVKKDRPGTPVGPPQPPLLITNEQLMHQNWWPVIGLVVENSPVEALLVDLMVDCVEGNSVITVKRDDVLQEAHNLLKLRAKPYTEDEALSRRELDKRARKIAEAERERLEREREERLLAETATQEGGGKPPHKSSKSQPSTAKNKAATAAAAAAAAGAVAADALRGQQPAGSQPAPSAQPSVRPRSLADDLFDELLFHNPGKSFEEILKTPSVPTLVLLIKYKLIQLKRYDQQVFDSVRCAREPFGDPAKAGDPISGTPSGDPIPPSAPVHQAKSPVNAKPGKSKEANTAAAAKETKASAPAGSLMVNKAMMKSGAAAKGKGGVQEEESTEPPQLADDETIVEPAHIECLNEAQTRKQSRARAFPEVPEAVAKLRLKQGGLSQILEETVDSNVKLVGGVQAERKSKVRETLMGDVAAGGHRGTMNGQAERAGAVDKAEEIASESERMKGLLLASIVGTDGLPPLNHALTTKLGAYGLPAFPTSRNQMVRYIILQGFTEGAILEEMTKQKASITCLFKIQFLRQRNASPLLLRNLLWVRRPAEQTETLKKFWSDVDRAVDVINPSAAAAELCPLALQIRFDISERTTRKDFEIIAKETSAQLASLFFQVVKAKTLFQFYNSSLALQPVPRFHRHHHMEKIDRPEIKDVYDFMADLTERGPRLRLPSFVEINLDYRDDEVLPMPVNATPGIAQDFLKNLELEMFQRGILPCVTRRQRVMSPLVDSRHKLRQKPRTIEQTAVMLGYLGLDIKNLPDFSTAVPNSDTELLRKILTKPEVAHMYYKQWIETLFRLIYETVRVNPVEFVKEEIHINSLAAAMSAWRTSMKAKKHPQPQEEIHEFQIPSHPSNLERNLPSPKHQVALPLKQLAKMLNYFAVIKYTTKQLLTKLATAHDHFFHHTIRYDASTNRIFLIFHALHEKNSHAFVRRSTTRLHSRADFPTFVCNIMENVQAWADENLNRAYRCPRRTQISPQFPYGCQGQLAYQPNCASFLSSPSQDHFHGFIRQYSLKNLVRNNHHLFAKRCNWRSRKKSTQNLNADTLSASVFSPPATKPAKRKPAFIWNRASDRLPPRCTVASTHKMTSAYSLSNVLTKIVRHEERIYSRNAVVSIDTNESYNEKTGVHITASVTEGLEIFMSNDEHGRSLAVEIDSRTRVCFEKTPQSGLWVSLLDGRKVQVKLDNDAVMFCEMLVPLKKEHVLIQSEKPLVLSFTRSGHLHRMLPDGRVETIAPNGRILRYVLRIPEPPPPPPVVEIAPEEKLNTKPNSKGGSQIKSAMGSRSHPPPIEVMEPPPPPLPPLEPILVLEEEVKPDPTIPVPKVSRRHVESANLAVHVTLAGLQKNIYRRADGGFTRRVQVAPDLRITTRRVTVNEEKRVKAGEEILTEQPGLPRVGVNTVTKVGHVSLPDGVLLMVSDGGGLYLLVAGVNVVLVTSDGLLSACRLRTFGDLVGIKGLDGLQGFASTDFLDVARQLLAAAQSNKEWQKNDSLIRFTLSGDILVSVQDLSGLQHDIMQNGEAVSQIWADGVDRCVMPSPRVFILDAQKNTGCEYVFSEEALNLKYKILHSYSPDRIQYRAGKSATSQTPSVFTCKVSDDPATDWSYADADVLPASLLSDLKGETNFRPSDGPAPRNRIFRAHNLSHAEEREKWKEPFLWLSTVPGIIHVEITCPGSVPPVNNLALSYVGPAFEAAVEESNREYAVIFDFSLTFLIQTGGGNRDYYNVSDSEFDLIARCGLVLFTMVALQCSSFWGKQGHYGSFW